MTPERYERLRKTLDRRQPDLTVLTDQVHKPHNVSAILRTCDAVGVFEAHSVLPDKKYQPVSSTSLGSERWVYVCAHATVTDALVHLRTNHFAIYAAHFSDASVDFRAIDYTRPTAVVLGAEKDGVSETAGKFADEHITIPMLGMVASYNVSVAAAIILSEAQRQRLEAGMYEEVRLDQKQYETTLFRWAHPVIADYCHRHNLDYPPLRDDGEIDNPAAWYRKVSKKMGTS